MQTIYFIVHIIHNNFVLDSLDNVTLTFVRIVLKQRSLKALTANLFGFSTLFFFVSHLDLQILFDTILEHRTNY